MTYRHIARIVIETKSPLNIGSGNKTIKTDSSVLKDVNGFPFIPGTTLAGLIRHSLDVNTPESLMGYVKGSDGVGSLLIVSEAKMLNSKGKVMDGILFPDDIDETTKRFVELPIRQHAKIGHHGATVKGGKFDEEVVLKGTRFCFELELPSDKSDNSLLHDVIDVIRLSSFRIGSGSRSGFGNIKIISCKCKTIDLSDKEDRAWYLEKSSFLSEDWDGAEYDTTPIKDANWIEYRLELQPSDFILFGSGLGNENADITYIRESYLFWEDNKAVVKKSDNVLVVPASSVKGAVSHRVAFYYNQKKGIFADQHTPEEQLLYVGDNNEAVKTLFGSEGRNGGEKQRGNVLISDVIQDLINPSPKVLNHVAIDRFTGGAIDGALFDEETLLANNEHITLTFMVKKTALIDADICYAFESALKDICCSQLPLGGGVNRGNGCFIGKILKNNTIL